MLNVRKNNIPILMLPLMILLLLISSCSKKRGMTRTKIFLGNSIEAGQLGGIMLYGMNNTTFQKFSKEVNGSELSLPNGNWSFIAIGWNNAQTFTGEARCALIEDQVLAGGDKTINLILKKSVCGNELFGNHRTKNGESQFNSLYPVSCGNYLSGRDEYDLNLGVGVVGGCTAGEMASYSVRMPEVNLSANFTGIVHGTGLTNCSAVSLIESGVSVISTPTQFFKIPSFNIAENTEIPIIVDTYKSGDCSGPSQKYIFNNGLSIPIPQSASLEIQSGINYLILNSSICSTTASLAVTRYQAGEATASTTNYICNEEQLKNISSNITDNKDKNFTLGKNIHVTGVFTQYIGVSGNAYSGTFDGNGKTISGLTINTTSQTRAGLFAETSGATIKNLHLQDITITADNSYRVGALIGYQAGGQVFNISADTITLAISNSTVNCVGIGGLIGHIEGAGKVEKIDVSNISISVDNGSAYTISSVGGIIGQVSLGSIKEVLANVINITDLDNNSSLDYGGLIGKLDSAASTLTDALASNITIDLVDKENIGGIIGKMSGGSASFIKSDATINLGNISILPNSIGGVVGLMTGANLSNISSTISMNIEGEHVGGITGKIDGNMVKSFINIAKVDGSMKCLTSSSSNCGSIVGLISGVEKHYIMNSVAENSLQNEGANTGGLVGEITTTTFSMSQMHSKSQINKTEAGIDYSASTYIGGLVGKNNGKIYNSYFDGSIANGSNYIGSLIGEMRDGVLKKVYSKSNIIPTGGNVKEDIGSFLTGTITDCYIAKDHSLGILSGSCTDVTASRNNASSYGGLGFTATTLAGTMTANNFFKTGTGLTTSYSTELDFGDTIKRSVAPGLHTVSKVIDDTSLSFLNETKDGYSNKIMVKLGAWLIDEGSSTPYLDLDQLQESFGNGAQIGSKQDPILISTKEQFNNIWERPSLMNYSFKLVNDLDFLEDASLFRSIGSKNNPFTGSFFGNNKKLKNIVIYKPAQENIGVFRVLAAGAQISDTNSHTGHERSLIIENIQVTGKNNVGGLAGLVDGNVKIRNIKIHSIASTITGENRVGGVIGFFTGGSSSDVAGFANYALVKNKIGHNGNAFGGIFGHIKIANPLEFSSMANHGFVNADLSISVGGIVGKLESTSVANSKFILAGSVGDVTGKEKVGGIAGEIIGPFELRHLFSRDATITADGGNYTTAGGLFGYISGVVTINGVYSTNNVVATNASNNNYAAGVVGKFAAEPSGVDNTFFTGGTLTGDNTTAYICAQGTMSLTTASVFSPISNYSSTAKSYEEMKYYNNISGLDFDNFFYVEEGLDIPRLFGEELILTGQAL